MTFKIALTVLFSVGIALHCSRIDEPREPISAGEAWFNTMISIVFIYGIWNWL